MTGSTLWTSTLPVTVRPDVAARGDGSEAAETAETDSTRVTIVAAVAAAVAVVVVVGGRWPGHTGGVKH